METREETEEVQLSLRSSLEALLQGREGKMASRLEALKESLRHTFQALPKNSEGRLAPRAVRYLVRSYFAKEHGWLIWGLEPHGMADDVTEVHEVSILQDRAPALVEALLEARQADHGLSLDDIVVMIGALERLILDESLHLLEAAYFLNSISADGLVAEEQLHEVLRSYLLVFEQGMRGNLSDVRKHRAIKREVARAGGSWSTIVEFEEDAVRNFGFANRDRTNPFLAPRYTFEAASHIVEGLAQDYGKWQNTECCHMKEQLISLDADGDGRVPLSVFYSQPDSATYQFTESSDYLRTIGALDETVRGSPRVRVANYMLGPSNCIASSSYYAVCCLSECDAIMSEVEGKVLASTAPAALLLGIMANLSSSCAEDAPRLLPQGLQDKMHGIAERHGGQVPLHGRLFAQWLHSAFPQECPYPHLHQSGKVLSPRHWVSSQERIVAAKEERDRHIEEAASVVQPHSAASPQPLEALEWIEEEVLPLQEPRRRGFGRLAGAARLAGQLAALLAALRAAYAGLLAAAAASSKPSKKKQSSPISLPLHL